MTRDDIIRMAREAGMRSTFVCADPNACPDDDECCHKNVPEGLHGRPETIERFAALVAAAEREKVAQWMMQKGYATGHGDTTEDLLAELDWQIAESWTKSLVKGVEGEREACAKLCDDLDDDLPDGLAGWQYGEAIRARGQA